MTFETLTTHVLTGMVSIAITLGLVIYLQPESRTAGLPTGIVTIDPGEAVMQFILTSGARDLTDAQYEPLALEYQHHLERAIDLFAAEHSVIVVNNAAVLSGAIDITEAVARDAIDAMGRGAGQ